MRQSQALVKYGWALLSQGLAFINQEENSEVIWWKQKSRAHSSVSCPAVWFITLETKRTILFFFLLHSLLWRQTSPVLSKNQIFCKKKKNHREPHHVAFWDVTSTIPNFHWQRAYILSCLDVHAIPTYSTPCHVERRRFFASMAVSSITIFPFSTKWNCVWVPICFCHAFRGVVS